MLLYMHVVVSLGGALHSLSAL